MDRWVTKELATFAVETHFENYPRHVVEAVKLLILDSIGCMLVGSQTKLGRAMIAPIKSMGGAPEATIVGGGVKVPTIQAAFVNGNTANALDYDDTLLGIGHPGASIIPSALAIGEWIGASGKDMITAILLGYDIGDRIGLAIRPSYERQQKVWGVGTWQTFSAVVAAAKVLNMDLKTTLNAYGVAGGTAPLPNTQKWGWSADERPIHWVKEPTGWPAWTGTTAAVLASHGFIGNNYILDGEDGFWIMAGSDQCDWDQMTAGLGREYEVVNHIAYKPYSSCRWQHAALDCVRELKLENDLSADDVEEIVIHSFAWVKSQEVYGPADMVDAEFAIPHTTAMLLSDVHPGPDWYTNENLRSRRVLELSRRVRVEVDPVLDKAYYEKDQLAARVEIKTGSGQRLETMVDLPRGDPRKPLTRQEIESKFVHQAAFCLDKDQITRVIETVDDLENLDDVNALTAHFVN